MSDRYIPAKVEQLFLSNMGFVVLLKNDNDERSLPILIGAAEAQAIALRINKVKMPRPMTHDLLKTVLDCFEGRLLRIEVCDLRDGTFYAKLILSHDGMEAAMDSRPSDAIALALRFDAPIYVAEKVMEEAGRVITAEQEEPDEANAKAARAPVPAAKPLTPLEVLDRDLKKAIQEERYEAAAHLRDQIRDIQASQSGN